MMESDFRCYLRNARHFKETTIGGHIANCRRVERYEGDLDRHFDNDQCCNLLWRLTYSAEDYRRQQQPKHNIPINGNVRTGSARLKQAVTLYVQFRRSRGALAKVERQISDELTPPLVIGSPLRVGREANPNMNCGCLIAGALWALIFVLGVIVFMILP